MSSDKPRAWTFAGVDMRELTPGIVVSCNSFEDNVAPLQLSSGTVKAPPVFGKWSYQGGAVIPAAEWREPTAHERSILVAQTPPANYGRGIGIVSIPPALLESFRELRELVQDARGEQELYPLLGSASCRHGTSTIFEYVRSCFGQAAADPRTEQMTGGIAIRPAGLPTITVQSRSNALVGLHLDSWYRRPLAEREQSPNRIVVNLGCQDRFFLFVNLSINQMYDTLSNCAPIPPSKDENVSLTARTFMESFPSYPVVRIRVRPGDAYIAPTENVAHDASSIGMLAPDVSLHIRGRFRLGAREAGEP